MPKTNPMPTLFGLALLCAGTAHAQDLPPPDEPADHEILVHGRAIEQIGVAISGSQGTVGYKDFDTRPIGRVGELVENVPGVIATQHSGTGKANQYFLRGFNLDHGTDFAGFVDGAPVNLRSHGHGQGYLDLNFLIPELVQRIDYRKGPYFADVGDFSAAGTAQFTTVDTLAPTVQATVGQYGYWRGLAAGSTAVGGGGLLVALDGTRSDGPWELDEELTRLNGLVKYSRGTGAHGWELGLTGYHATWNATDQVPRRAIDSGAIDRFGFIDPDLGGETTRIGLTANARFAGTRLTLFGLYYRLRLTSNFTYFLADPVHGDQFQQRDQRMVFGGSLRHDFATGFGQVSLGAEARYDRIRDVGLYRSSHGVRTGAIRQDDIEEASGAVFAQATAALTPRLRLVLGLRGDLYGYDVRAETLAPNSGSGTDALLSPKAALAWTPADGVELYANYGEGFHSNDVRGAATRIDPATGAPADPVPVLVKARGAEIGARIERGPLTASLVGFYLSLDSELVYVGDAGTTEPNAASRRYGAEATLFWRPTTWLTLDGAAALTHARLRSVAAGEDRIPNSVDFVLSGGAEVELGNGLSGSLRVRHFGAAPLVEDDSARSRPTTLANLGGYYRLGRVRLGLDLLNLFDARASDITYFYASRLPGEPARGVDDYHLHPVEPRQARMSLSYSF